MYFAPEPVTVQAVAGTATPFYVTATPATPAEFYGYPIIYAYIVDANGVVGSTVHLTADGGSYTAELYTTSTIVAGNYTGNLVLHVCPTSNCSSEFPGSPWTEPYNITITPQ